MSHKEFFEKNGGTKLISLYPSDDDVEVEGLYQAFKARMQAEADGAVPDKANDNVVKICTSVVIPQRAVIQISDADYLHIRFQTPRGGRLVSVTLEFAED